MTNSEALHPADQFADRHLGPSADEIDRMLEVVGADSLDGLIERAVPATIRSREALSLPPSKTESELLQDMQKLAADNQCFRSYLGMGYSGCVTPPVILRNILEDPAWYTQYTAYQSEISQGRLEALLNFQTMVSDLTGLPVANASLLDEATAAAEAMALCHRVSGGKAGDVFFVAEDCHPQTIAVVQTRGEPLGLEVVVGPLSSMDPERTFGVLLQYPNTHGAVEDYESFCAKAHEGKVQVVVACDLLALTLLRPPGEFGADIAVGSAQRFGVPMGMGGPHAAFLATTDAHKRKIPGRIVGVSRDQAGNPALRLALQTREQHIRRDRATSNICTAQVLLAVVAGTYAVYHGPDGLRRIAARVRGMTRLLAKGLQDLGCTLRHEAFFDTLKVTPAGEVAQILARAANHQINLRSYADGDLGIALDETVGERDVLDLLAVFSGSEVALPEAPGLLDDEVAPHGRTSSFLNDPVFRKYHTETELLRYVQRLAARDLSLTTSMIPLGSCTMKLNATAEMLPITWPQFANIHPFAPKQQTRGYHELFRRLEAWLASITGFEGVSLQPNAGSQGEYSGLLVIRAYQQSRGEADRNVCLIPTSAHGTNPASAVMAGMKVVPVQCDDAGNIELANLRANVEKHKDSLAALMVTYPSTHGVFEESIREICDIVHRAGGQVYLDGANMNAMVGICRPGDIGADVCHLNLHKTFCIPHGGGGPGMGPIGVASHLVPFLPGHPMESGTKDEQVGAISAAPYGSPMVLPISYAYIAMMGAEGLTRATQIAILSANYMAHRLQPHFPVLYRGQNGCVAHECIVDLRECSKASGVDVEDVAKRLMDYGFHAPTVSFPVPGTMMIEPTESESLEEIDRYCDALISIRQEIRAIEEGTSDRKNNPLKNAPHTIACLIAEDWDRPYSRETAAFPLDSVREHKFWPSVGRIDNVAGDRNLVCCWIPEFEEQVAGNGK